MFVASPGAKGNLSMLGGEDYKPVRELLYRINVAKSNPDIIGQTSVHRINAVGDAAKVRTGAPGVVKDLRVQWSAHIAKERSVAERAAEIDELYKFLGKNQTMKNLADGNPIKYFKLGKKSNSQLVAKAGVAVNAMSDQLGVQLGVLDPELLAAVYADDWRKG